MSIIKNGQITLYCQFNKTKKGPGTSLQYQAKNILELFVIQHTSIWPSFILIGKKIKIKKK